MIGFTIVLKKRKNIKMQKKTGKKFLYFLPVIFIMVFSVCASFFIDKSEDGKFENNEQKDNSISVFREINDYSLYYLPIVMNEFFEYEKGEKISDDMLIKIGVMSILSTENMQSYEAFDGELAISEKEVRERVKTIFSDNTDFKNKTPKNSEYRIVYDNDTKNYIIPTQGFSPRYSAVLESVTAKSDEIVLSVGCLESDSFKQDSSGKTIIPEAEKKIEIILKKDKTGYYIEKIL